MAAFTALLATGAVLLNVSGASARGWVSDRELLSISDLACGEEAGESCCPPEYGSCAPGLVCMSDGVCEPCGESMPCDEDAASLWMATHGAELPLDLAGLEAQSGSYGDDLISVYGDVGGFYGEELPGIYGSDDDLVLTEGPDEVESGTGASGPGGSGTSPSTEDTTSVTDRSTELPGVSGSPADSDGTTSQEETAGTSSSSTSVPAAAAAVAGCAALIAGVSVLVYTKRATLFRSPAPAAAV